MNIKVSVILLLLRLASSPCLAQGTILVLDASMFSPNQRINLATNPNLNTISWARLNPSTLSVKDTDKIGRVEGWFRLRIRLYSYGIITKGYGRTLTIESHEGEGTDLTITLLIKA